MQIPPEELKTKNPEDIYLLDVRNPQEQDICIIPGTKTLIPVKELTQRVKELEPYKNKQIIIYCRGGVRSAKACKILQEAGFTNVNNLKGGILAYIEKVDPSLPVY